MKTIVRYIADQKSLIIGFLLIVAAVLLYESGQQLYFIKQYEIVADPSFWDIMLAQCRRWIVWTAMLPLLIYAIRSMTDDVSKSRLAASVIATCLVAIIVVSLVEMIVQQGIYVGWNTYQEYLTFFFYQKGPIYLLGYISIGFLYLFRVENERLRFEVRKIDDLKQENESLALRMQELSPQEEQVLSIRIGKKQKIISLSDVLWIEADDYCAKVHSAEGRAYSMRISLKALEKDLPAPFMRVHRSAIVNLAQVKEIVYKPKPSLVLTGGARVPVAKTRMGRVSRDLTASFLQ